MPALTLPGPTKPNPSTKIAITQDPSSSPDPDSPRTATPPRPSYSPVTPVLSHATLARGLSDPTFQTPPSPVPISESDNTDIIALRSALSILQMQRERAVDDIRQLKKLKDAAVAAPEAFAAEISTGRMQQDADHERRPFLGITATDVSEADASSMDVDGLKSHGPQLRKIPQPQNVVRCPPVNWAKYHVVGEPLERMHEERRRFPMNGEPRRDDPVEHVVAAPYRPFVDGKVKGWAKKG